MSGPRSDKDEDVAAAGATDSDEANLSVEDDPQGTTDPGDLAGSGDSGDDAVS